jgi:hypothetical protein
MLVDAKSPYKDLQEFIAHAKKRPRSLTASPVWEMACTLPPRSSAKGAGISMAAHTL